MFNNVCISNVQCIVTKEPPGKLETILVYFRRFLIKIESKKEINHAKLDIFLMKFFYDFLLDKLCDQVSDAILDAHLKQDPNAKVACGELTFSMCSRPKLGFFWAYRFCAGQLATVAKPGYGKRA